MKPRLSIKQRMIIWGQYAFNLLIGSSESSWNSNRFAIECASTAELVRCLNMKRINSKLLEYEDMNACNGNAFSTRKSANFLCSTVPILWYCSLNGGSLLLQYSVWFWTGQIITLCSYSRLYTFLQCWNLEHLSYARLLGFVAVGISSALALIGNYPAS